MAVKIGVLTLSDRASNGIYEDISGKAAMDILREFIANECEFCYKVIPDEFELIKQNLVQMCDEFGADLLITTGGTGPAKRDVTPEATQMVCEKMLPGFGELMRQASLKSVPTAILSRQSAGIRGKTLIVNLPGKPKAILECLEPIFPAIPYCIDLIGGEYIKANENRIKIFRPKK